MNRAIPVVVFAVLLVGCKPPSLHLRARAMSDKFAALIGKDGAPPMQPVAINLRKQPKRSAATSAPARRPTHEPVRPTVTTIRHDRSRPPRFLLKGVTHGGEPVCRAFPTMDACTDQCVFDLRYAGLTATPAPSMTRQCACYELDESC